MRQRSLRPQLKRDPLGGRSLTLRTVLRKTLFATYSAAVLLTSGVTAAGWFIAPGTTLHSLGFLAFLLAPVLALGILMHTARFPSRRRFIQAGIVIGLGVAAWLAAPELRPTSLHLYFRHHQGDFQHLADMTLASPIRRFWDAGDEWAMLNDRYVALSNTLPAPIGVLHGAPIVFLDSALDQDHIPAPLFHDLRLRLRSLHATIIRVDSDAVQIGRRDAGFLYLRPGAPERPLGDYVGLEQHGPRLVAKLGERWYYAYW